jgi:replicative DNA helicase
MTTKSQNRESTRAEIPTAPSAELAAISIILQNHETLDNAKWDADLFLNPTYRVLLSVAKECHNEGHKADLFRIQSVLEQKGQIDEIGGYHGLMEIFTAYPCGDMTVAIDFRRDLMKARRYRKAMQRIAESRDDIRDMRADLNGIAQQLIEEDEETTTADSIKTQCLKLIDVLERTTPPDKFRSGIAGLDLMLNGGFERGTVAVFSSETSGGKSIILLQVALQSALNGKKGIIFSLEMSASQVIGRLVANKSGWKCVSLFENPSKAQQDGMMQGIAEVAKLPITIHDGISDIDSIESICRQAKRGGIDFVVVDYIQLCSASADSKSETREQQVSEVVRRLKLLALNLDICVLTASQLNDKGELRESRGIGHHADYVMMIDHSGHPDTELKISKQRNGERNISAPVTMMGSLSRFIDRERKRH